MEGIDAGNEEMQHPPHPPALFFCTHISVRRLQSIDRSSIELIYDIINNQLGDNNNVNHFEMNQSKIGEEEGSLKDLINEK